MEILSLFKYLATVVLTNDANNIWLYTLQDGVIEHVYAVGLYIAALLGGA